MFDIVFNFCWNNFFMAGWTNNILILNTIVSTTATRVSRYDFLPFEFIIKYEFFVVLLCTFWIFKTDTK